MADRVILHSDINCCYASIEHLHHPELAGKPLAVGGDPEARHGIVLTADYIAKKYGVKTGMALWQAKQVCPDITFVSPRMDLYLRFSRMAHEIYAEYTDRQEPYGIDECWLDVTGSSSLKGDGLLIAQEISRRMKSELGITVSVGVSFNKIFAKLGSDYKKPDAITTMYKSEFKQKAWSLPVADLLYVGKSTNRKLALFGIKTIGDLARTDEDVLNSHLGKMGSILWSFANGYDDSPVKLENTHAPIKSVGNSTTTPKDLVCDEDVKIVLYILAESVAARLRENGFRCRVVEISVRDNELFSFTRQKKIDHATNITGEIAAYAYQLFKAKDDKGKVHQKSETFAKRKDAERRQHEVEYQIDNGIFKVAKCVTVEDLLNEYVKLYGKEKWAVTTYSANMGLINNYILPVIGKTDVSSVNNHFVEKFYRTLSNMPAVDGANNKKSKGNVSPNTIFEIHKILRSCFRQAVKWGIMEKNPAIDATLPKRNKKKREIWTAEMLMQAIEACDEKWLEAAFHLAFTATLRIGEILALTWDCVDISDEAIETNRCYIVINKIIERVSVEALDFMDRKDIITIFPTQKRNNTTVVVMKTPKTETSNRKVYIPSHVGKCLKELKAEQNHTKEILGNEYKDYNLVLATTFGMPIGASHVRTKMKQIIKKEGLPDVVFHSLRHTSVTYKLKLSGGDIKAVQGDSGHAQADMVTEVYGHILDEDRKKNAQLMENAFYNKENLNPDIHGASGTQNNNNNNMISVPEGVDADMLMKVLENPEMAALLTSLAKSMKG